MPNSDEVVGSISATSKFTLDPNSEEFFESLYEEASKRVTLKIDMASMSPFVPERVILNGVEYVRVEAAEESDVVPGDEAGVVAP